MNRRLSTVTVGAVGMACLLFAPPAQPQDATNRVLVPEVMTAVNSDISIPLREMRVRALPPARGEINRHRRGRPDRIDGGNATDPLARIPSGESAPAGLKLNFDGQGANGSAPPDTNGAPGATQYVQWVNTVWNVYDKNTGTKLGGPFPGTQFWSGLPGRCAVFNSGDPIIQYDKAAGRWVAMQFAIQSFSATSICIAVSTTPDALGTYARYEFDFGNQFPDYPKLGVWSDGYYVTVRTFPNGNFFSGSRSCAMDRTKMLAGLPAPTAICFQLTQQDDGMLPGDLDGPTPPPLGSPNYQVELGTSTTLKLWKYHVDFVTPANSTFTGPTNLTVASYTEACFSSCVPQPAPGSNLDALGPFMMYRLAYRNFGTHESLLANHTVNNAGKSAVRWYELRGLGTSPTVFQQGTVAAGNVHLWMGSIAQDKMGNIALGFSASNSGAVKPTVAVTGRLPGDPPGTMRTPVAIMLGTGVQTGGLSRWGDYSAMAIDPLDDCTMWYTTEYLKTNGSFNWSTRIASFTFPNCQ